MALSQFDEKLTVSGSSGPEHRQDQRKITVGGPLEIAAPEDYEHPIAIRFQVVQVPRGKHTQADVKRVRGRGEEFKEGGKLRWRGSVKLGPLVTGKADVIKKETRGVAIAVLERTNQFAFDTITWCDEIELVDAEPTKAPPDRKPKGRPSPSKKPSSTAAPARKPAAKAAPAKKPTAAASPVKKPASKTSPVKKPRSKASRAKPASGR